MADIKSILTTPIFNKNPIALQILGICSALAVTTSVANALVMCIALTLVTAFSSFLSRLSVTKSHHRSVLSCRWSSSHRW